MKQTMKWLFIEEQGNSVIYRCSVCNSEISVKHGEELPYCKHCESEPDGEQFETDNEIIQTLYDLIKSTEKIKYGARKKVIIDAEVVKTILNFINRQQAKIKAQQMDNKQLENDNFNANMNCEHLQAEIERLEANLNEAFEEIEALKQIKLHCKAEAVKEFAERLKECARTVDDDYSPNGEFTFVEVEDIDKAYEEMVGEN